jgi:hypothetical protein
MKWTQLMVGSLCMAVVACNGNKGDDTNSGSAGTGSESGSMQNGASGTATDTMTMMGSDTASMQSGASGTTSGATGGTSTDTARSRSTAGTPGSSDSAKGNQTKSGVTNTKTGKSTLGKGVTQTRPDQGQPVTSKGDTISSSAQPTSGDTSSSR